jgi:hypothetical protein
MTKHDRADEYRQRAGEIRQKVDATDNAAERQEWVEIAAALDRWANVADAKAAFKRGGRLRRRTAGR